MAVMFPPGFHPFIFSDTLPADTADLSTAILDRHSAAFDVADVNAAVPAGATSVFLSFVVFAYPDPANTETRFPKPPIVELLPRGAGFDGRGVALRPTPVGTASLDLGAGMLINYTFRSLGFGVFQIMLTPNTVQLSAVDWRVRFTVADGVTGPRARLGLTLTAGTEDGRAGWLAVPGQDTLSAAGPAVIDVGGALRGITLAGAQPADPALKLPTGQPIPVAIPLANYGAAPLTISACQPSSAGNFDVALPAPLVLPPGARGSVTLTYRPPDAGETGNPAAATRFTLVCDDALAGSAHPNTLAFYASSITFPVLAPSPQFSHARGVPPVELDDGERLVCEITILGRNLALGNVAATFGRVPAESIRPSPAGLILGVPAVIVPNRERVTVTNDGGSVTSTDLFTISAHPTINDVDPFIFGDHGDSPAGRSFSIMGSGFVIEPGGTIRASAVLRTRPDGVHQVESEALALEVLSATDPRMEVKAGAVADFNRYVGGTVTIRVDRSDGGVATVTLDIAGL